MGWAYWCTNGDVANSFIAAEFPYERRCVAVGRLESFALTGPIMFPIVCPHQQATKTVTVGIGSCVNTISSDELMEVVCESCFQDAFSRWALSEARRAPQDCNLVCAECGRSPARWYHDMDDGMCEECKSNLFEEERGFHSVFNEYPVDTHALPDEIIPKCLFLGSLESAIEPLLEIFGIRHVLVCGASLPLLCATNTSIVYHRIPLSDSLDEDILRYLPDACRFISNCSANSQPVLVHCQAGVSRSASICIAYIMKSQRLPLPEALEMVKKRRPCISPNENFIDALEMWGESLEPQR